MEKNNIVFKKIPNHLAIIMDGNGRWAKNRSLPRYMGHSEGAKRVVEIVEECYKLGIKHLSLYAFSTENWKRPAPEIEKLMQLLLKFIDKELMRLHKNEVKINIMGSLDRFSPKIREACERALQLTKSNDKMILNIALNYGSKAEIIRACRAISKEVKEGKIDIEDIDNSLFSEYLYTSFQPDVDFLIRPSGEYRLSNFMLYQSAYAEFYFSDILWPDFDRFALYDALADYEKRDRRFGGLGVRS